MISDIERAGAIRILSVAACTPGFFVDFGWKHIEGASEQAWDVAFAAYYEARGDFAEAEALLRTGWSPP